MQVQRLNSATEIKPFSPAIFLGIVAEMSSILTIAAVTRTNGQTFVFDAMCVYGPQYKCTNSCNSTDPDVPKYVCWFPPTTGSPGACVPDNDPAPSTNCYDYIQDCGNSHDCNTAAELGRCINAQWCYNS